MGVELLPFVGIVSKCGYTEFYGYEKAEASDFHHSFCLSEKGLSLYDNDDTLRFVLHGPHTGCDKLFILLEGQPALDPYKSGRKQIEAMCELYLSRGAEDMISIEVADHYLGTRYEGCIIGNLKRF